MQQSIPLFPERPILSETEIKEYMDNLGVKTYGRYIEIVLDFHNLDIESLNKKHPLYERIIKAKENISTDGFASFRI
ncbi:MAG: hypothetical protein DI539_00805 [Flavobacterium psychrophilum]|nr:MAG: hypothetical protein DI539_00805 [Flavobacterium psychrophilum]